MNQAILDTKVTLNLAVSPSLSFLPRSIILWKNPTKGYNNCLKIASPETVFGLNNINYDGTINQTKKAYQETPTHHLESLDNKIEPKIHKTKKLDTFEESKKPDIYVNTSLEKLGKYKKEIGVQKS